MSQTEFEGCGFSGFAERVASKRILAESKQPLWGQVSEGRGSVMPNMNGSLKRQESQLPASSQVSCGRCSFLRCLLGSKSFRFILSWAETVYQSQSLSMALRAKGICPAFYALVRLQSRRSMKPLSLQVTSASSCPTEYFEAYEGSGPGFDRFLFKASDCYLLTYLRSFLLP